VLRDYLGPGFFPSRNPESRILDPTEGGEKNQLKILSRLTFRGRGVAIAKLVARLLATTALWVRIQTSSETQKWATKQRSAQHTLFRLKNNTQKNCSTRRGNKLHKIEVLFHF
jgi:hypothetical protein